MWKLDKELRSNFAQEIDVMRGLPDANARRNKLFSILQTLVSSMGGGSDGYSSRTGRGAAAEFFTNSMNSLQIPFYLIGMDEIPKACRSTDDNINPKPWDRWMQSSGENGYVSQFDDPDALARTVESRMNLMIKSANEKAGVFFRQRLVIDLLNLVNKTLVGQNITVRQSLKHVDRYLERFNTRLTSSFDDDVMRGSVLETRQRIQKVLSAYNGLAKYGKSLKAGTPLIDDHGKVVDGEQAMLDGAKAVIDAVFGQLNVLYQSDVFLTNRLTTFIERDFAILMKNSGGRLSEDQSQLMKIAQEHLLEKMIDVHGLNPTSAQNDLANAQVVNVRNLQGVEEVFSDTMYVMLEELNQIAKGKPTDAAAMAALMQKRYEADKERYRKQNSSLSFYYLPWEPYQKMVEWFFAGTIIKNKSPDLYQQPFNDKRVTSGDTPFGDFARFRAQICAQTLAFESRTRFLPLCQGAVLKSFYSEPAQITSLDLPYDSYLPRVTFNSQITADPYKSAKAKCALNDYNIRNWVRLLEDRDRSADSSEEE